MSRSTLVPIVLIGALTVCVGALGAQRDAARRERDDARDSLAIAKVAVDECRWAVAELASSDPPPLIPFMATADDSGRWAARLFKWRTRQIILGRPLK